MSAHHHGEHSFFSFSYKHIRHFCRLKEISLFHVGEDLVWKFDLHFLQQHLEQKTARLTLEVPWDVS